MIVGRNPIGMPCSGYWAPNLPVMRTMDIGRYTMCAPMQRQLGHHLPADLIVAGGEPRAGRGRTHDGWRRGDLFAAAGGEGTKLAQQLPPP